MITSKVSKSKKLLLSNPVQQKNQLISQHKKNLERSLEQIQQKQQTKIMQKVQNKMIKMWGLLMSERTINVLANYISIYRKLYRFVKGSQSHIQNFIDHYKCKSISIKNNQEIPFKKQIKSIQLLKLRSISTKVQKDRKDLMKNSTKLYKGFKYETSPAQIKVQSYLLKCLELYFHIDQYSILNIENTIIKKIQDNYFKGKIKITDGNNTKPISQKSSLKDQKQNLQKKNTKNLNNQNAKSSHQDNKQNIKSQISSQRNIQKQIPVIRRTAFSRKKLMNNAKIKNPFSLVQKFLIIKRKLKKIQISQINKIKPQKLFCQNTCQADIIFKKLKKLIDQCCTNQQKIMNSAANLRIQLQHLLTVVKLKRENQLYNQRKCTINDIQ